MQKIVDEIFQRFEEKNPHPEGELYYTNVFTLLVAVVLSAQATDKGVNKATHTLFKIIKTPEDVLSLGEEALKKSIRTIGLYQSKARHLMALAMTLKDRFHSQVPNTFKDLICLPGVGPKTANVVLNIAFHQPTIAVDTHVFRVAHRLHLSKATTPEKVESDLLRVITPRYLMYAHHWLILHGRYVCKSRAPLCSKCMLNDICPSYEKFVSSGSPKGK